MSFSIIAYCKTEKILGSAIATNLIAAGGIIPVYRKNIGLVHTQGEVFPKGAETILDQIQSKQSMSDSLEHAIKNDKNKNLRQYLVCNNNGEFLTFNGEECHDVSYTATSHECVAGGNILNKSSVVDTMIAAYEENHNLDLAERLILALESGEKEGGEKRGIKAASLHLFSSDYPASNKRLPNLRIDHHQTPISELKKLYQEFIKNGERFFLY